MSKAARIRQHATQIQWSGPTPVDVYKASGRENVMIRFVRTGRGPYRELLVQIGPAYLGNNNSTVTFSGRTVDGEFTIKGFLDGSLPGAALAIIERTPYRWLRSRAG
jgi:hypothetical protein